jgi:phosphonopyruvate decarboxylase
MGGAASLGLGLALAQPTQRVIVVDGDGSLLMQLGGLVTVSGQRPSNFVHFVVHNGSQFTGGANLQLPGKGQADFPGLARAAGYRRVETFSEREALAECIGELVACEGPVFVELRVQAEPVTLGLENPQTEMPDRQFKRMGEEARLLQVYLERAQ